MNRYVAFMRAINVAGHASVSMSNLRDAFVAAGCMGVRTYIQSGNVIFGSPERNPAAVFQRVRIELGNLLGDAPGVFFRTVRQAEGIVREAPFMDFEAERDIKLYVTFLSRRPRSRPRFPLRSSTEALEAVKLKNLEVLIVSGRKRNGFYGIPNLFIEKELGGSATSRNWSTVTKIVEIVRERPDG